jgi:DNA-binding NarL/FixJ family response regulator
MDKIRIVLADDHSILRQGTATMLSAYDDIEVVDVAANGEDLLKMIQEHKPHILVSDIGMPGISVFEILEIIEQEGISTKVLLLTMHDTPDYIFKALEYNISGYLTKDTVKDELVKAIRTIYQGGEFYGQNITQSIIRSHKIQKDFSNQNRNPLTNLSVRELEVLDHIAQGLTTRQIADKLFLSERTVSNHRSRMLQKCEVNNTVELVRMYLDHKK